MSSIWMPQLANQVSGVLRYKSLTSCNSRKTARWRPACSCLRRGSMRIDGTNEIYYLAMVEVEGYKKFDWSKKFSRKIFKNWYSRLGSIWQRTDFTNESYTNSVGSKEISKLIFFRRKIFKKLISYVQEDGRIFFLHLRFWWQLWPPTNGLRRWPKPPRPLVNRSQFQKIFIRFGATEFIWQLNRRNQLERFLWASKSHCGRNKII